MAPSGGFHFVNPDNSSATGHKAQAKARAFVARKSRSDWSTKSENKNDRRKISRRSRKTGQSLPTISACGCVNDEQPASRSLELEKDLDNGYKTLQKASSDPRPRGKGMLGVCRFCGPSLEEPENPNAVSMSLICPGHLTLAESRPQLPAMDASLSSFGSAAVTVEPSCMTLLGFCL